MQSVLEESYIFTPVHSRGIDLHKRYVELELADLHNLNEDYTSIVVFDQKRKRNQ